MNILMGRRISKRAKQRAECWRWLSWGGVTPRKECSRGKAETNSVLWVPTLLKFPASSCLLNSLYSFPKNLTRVPHPGTLLPPDSTHSGGVIHVSLPWLPTLVRHLQGSLIFCYGYIVYLSTVLFTAEWCTYQLQADRSSGQASQSLAVKILRRKSHFKKVGI